MVLLHGLGGDRNQWLDLMPKEFPFRALLPDLPGHGQADWLPRSGCSFNSFADAVHQWLFTASVSPLGTEQIILGGISMGAGVAIRLALLAPERVSRLILIRPAWLDRPLPDNLMLLERLGQEWIHRGVDQTLQWLQQDEEYQLLMAKSPECAKLVKGQLSRPYPTLAARTLVDMAADRPIISPLELHQLTMPALILGSAHDPQHPISMVHTLSKWLPNANFKEVAPRYNQPEAHRKQIQQQLVSFLKNIHL